LDNTVTRHPDKAALIRGIAADAVVDMQRVPYVGDKWEDGEAADANGMPFFAAGWGYGSWDSGTMPAGWNIVNSPHELIAIMIRG
jgi:phosphoglycolate phosphatase